MVHDAIFDCQYWDTRKCGADLQIRSPLVSFNHVTDPRFVTFSSSLYTTISNPNPNANPNTNPNPNPNHNHNPTVITDPQIGPIDPQIVIALIRPAHALRYAFCRVPSVLRNRVVRGSIFIDPAQPNPPNN